MPFIIGGAILGGAAISGIASNMAAGTQSDAATNAANLQAQQFRQTRSDLQPWQQSGVQSLGALNYLLGVNPGQAAPSSGQIPGMLGMQQGSLLQPFDLSKFQASPAYQFNLQQGQQALDKAANARGNYYAPQTLQDVSKFSQGLASNEFMNAYNMYNQNQGNLFNRLFSMSGTGQSAANQTGTFGASTANNMGMAGMLGGASQAAGIMGVGNSLTGGLQNAYSLYQGNQNTQQLNQILAQLQGGTDPLSMAGLQANSPWR